MCFGLRRKRCAARRSCHRFRRKRAEAPLALREMTEGIEELGAAKIRPHGLEKKKLGIRGLKQEKVAKTTLAAGADYEVRVDHPACLKPLRKGFDRYRVRLGRSLFDGSREI